MRRLLEAVDVDVWVIAEDLPEQIPNELGDESVDLVWALLDRTFVQPAFARKLFEVAGPTRTVLNAGGVTSFLRAVVSKTGRGDAAAATWIFR